MKLSTLATVLRRYGLTVVEHPGWASRGYLGRDLIAINGVLWHHTATNRAAFNNSTAPTAQMCIVGRPDVAGPLCHIVFARDGAVHLIAAGLANHAGPGATGTTTVPRDMGNYYLIGIEMESSGIAPWDWTEDQKRVAPYLGAALELAYLQHLPPELRYQGGHLEYSSQRKIDPAGWPGGMDGLRAAINATIPKLAGGTPAPAAPAAAEPDEVGPRWIVERGDTLAKIAAYYGIPTEVRRIAAHNRIKDPNRLKVGQKIYIPGPLVWIVERGDTWEKINAYYGYAQGAVQSRNPGASLTPGTVLKVWG